MTNQNWNDPAQPQGQQPSYGQPAEGQQPTYGQPSDPAATPGYQAPGQTPDPAYGQSYGSTPSYGQQAPYGASSPSQPNASTYGSPSPSYGAAEGTPGAASPYGQTPAYGSGTYGDQPQADQPGAASYGSAGSYGAPDAGYGQQPQNYGTPVAGQGGSYGSPVQPGYSDPAAGQAGGYDPYAAQQSGSVSPYGYDSGYATPAPALADFGKRALGGLIDYVAPGFVVWILIAVLGGIGAAIDRSGTLSMLLSLLGYVALLGFLIWNTVLKGGNTGVTIGRGIAKTKLVSEATGQPIGAMNAFIRHLCHFVDSLICYIGWLFPLWDTKRQTLADKIMKTVVITDDGTPTQGQQF